MKLLLRIWRLLRAEIAFGFLIASVFWIAVLGWQAAYAPTDAEKQKCYDDAKRVGYKAEECKTLWERTTSDPVAFFTLWLVIFTGGLTVSTVLLWRAGERQFRHGRRTAVAQNRDMRASIAVADRAAKAAELSAKAAIGSKLPSIRVGKIRLFKPGAPYGGFDDYFKNEIFEGRPPIHSQVLIPVSNLGDTNAEITGISVNWLVTGHLNGLPADKNVLSFTETVIKAGAEFEFAPTNFFLNFTKDEDRALDLVLATHLWVYGHISYVDFMDTRHKRRFCQRWTAGLFLGSPKGFVPEWSTAQESNLENY